MTIKQVLIKYHQLEIDLLLSHILGKSREFLFLNPEYRLSGYQAASLSSLVKRRKSGEPIAYILGYKDFYGLRFKVNRDVLIPRPETEKLVSQVLKVCKVNKVRHKIKILDVGTGSGCIAVSLAKQFSISPTSSRLRRAGNFQFSITASDISKKALSVAKTNAKRHHAKIKFIQSNLFKNIKGKFDVIVANLPYVTKRNYELRITNLGFEPKTALTDNTNQRDIFQQFFKQLPGYIHSGSKVFLEIDPKSKKYLSAWAKRYLPKSKIQFYRDYNNLWRYAVISL